MVCNGTALPLLGILYINTHIIMFNISSIIMFVLIKIGQAGMPYLGALFPEWRQSI
jgi:hypothetical protein